MNFDDRNIIIMEQILEMSDRQKITVINSIDCLLTSSVDYASQEARFYDSIAKAIRSSSGMPVKASYSIYLKRHKIKTLTDKLKVVDDFLSETLPSSTKRLTRQKGRNTIIRLVVDHIAHYKGILSISSVLRKIEDIDALVEFWFPGMIKSGKGFLILKETNKK